METGLSEIRKDPLKFASYISSVTNGYCSGKAIQIRGSKSTMIGWIDEKEPSWSWETVDYRIKPQPKVVPFSMEDMVPGMWCKPITREWFAAIQSFDKLAITYANRVVTYDDLYNNFEWSTDFKVWKPFHKVIEE